MEERNPMAGLAFQSRRRGTARFANSSATGILETPRVVLRPTRAHPGRDVRVRTGCRREVGRGTYSLDKPSGGKQ